MKRTALYLRSTKDRSDVSIDAQRRELTQLAKSKDLICIHEYVDVVQSAKDENRPAFQELLHDVSNKDRKWTHLLILDTARLARRQYMAHVFDHECSKRGITIIYAKIPESDPITEMVLKGVLRVFDELHSLMSRQKGLAGMSENVKQGFRAGGKAPRGYVLEHVPTGAIRDGEPVTKSRLILGEDSEKIKNYLVGRAKGIPRSHLGLDLKANSLGDLEWNALTYAGHTVWNMRFPKNEGRKRRPRSDWTIKKNTHPALITDEEAESILARLKKNQGTFRRNSKYLLSGLMETPNGKPWQGTTMRGISYYRAIDGKSKSVRADELEKAITEKIRSAALQDDVINGLAEGFRNKQSAPQRSVSPLNAEIAQIDKKVSALLEMATEMENKTAIARKIDELEAIRSERISQVELIKESNALTVESSRITNAQIRQVIKWNDRMEELLPTLVEKIILDPKTLNCDVQFSFKMASPRGFELKAEYSAQVKVA